MFWVGPLFFFLDLFEIYFCFFFRFFCWDWFWDSFALNSFYTGFLYWILLFEISFLFVGFWCLFFEIVIFWIHIFFLLRYLRNFFEINIFGGSGDSFFLERESQREKVRERWVWELEYSWNFLRSREEKEFRFIYFFDRDVLGGAFSF